MQYRSSTFIPLIVTATAFGVLTYWVQSPSTKEPQLVVRHAERPKFRPARAALKEIKAHRGVAGHRADGVAEPQLTPSPAPESVLRDIELLRAERGGFVVQLVNGASIYDRLGLQPGDVVHDIDKLIDLQYPGEALEHFKDREVRFEIFRDGYPIFVSFRIDQ
jgi:hypothetical protein